MNSYRESVVPIIREVREMVLPYFGNPGNVRHKDESGQNLVTELDEKVESFLSTRLRALYPTIEFVGEEGGGNRMAERFWLLDPIDGTSHFVRGLPFCTTMLALIDQGEVVFSAIYDFVRDEMYVAEKGMGATKNGEKIFVSNRSLREAYMCYEIKQNTENGKLVYQKLIESTFLFNSINAGFEYAMIASGKLDGRVCVKPFGKDYDYAPGSLLVKEAGGIVTNIGSALYDYRNLDMIAVNPTIYKELTEGENPLFPIQK